MNQLITYSFITFFIISNIIVFIKIYKLKLQYLQPSRGYFFSSVLLILLVGVDYTMYSTIIPKKNVIDSEHLVKVRIENTLNRLTDRNISDTERRILTQKLITFSDAEKNVVKISQSDINAIKQNTNIKDYTNQLQFVKTQKVIKINGVQFSENGKVKYLEVAM